MCLIVVCIEASVPPGFFVKVEELSQEYKELNERFHKKWKHKEKKCPELSLVLAIVNPSLDERFSQYQQDHIKDKKAVTKRWFHGAKLDCDLLTYQVPCTEPDCRMCHLSLQGFGLISSTGIMLDKNPGTSHDNSTPHEGSLMYGLLVCEVTYQNTKKVRRYSNDGDMRPEGFDAVRVKKSRASIIRHSTDTMVIYNTDTLCPRYILLYI